MTKFNRTTTNKNKAFNHIPINNPKTQNTTPKRKVNIAYIASPYDDILATLRPPNIYPTKETSNSMVTNTLPKCCRSRISIPHSWTNHQMLIKSFPFDFISLIDSVNPVCY